MLVVDVDLADDRFDVTYDPSRIAAEDLLGSIRELGYEPELVLAAEPPTDPDPAAPMDLAQLPEDLATLFARARQTGKPVLLQFSGPG